MRTQHRANDGKNMKIAFVVSQFPTLSESFIVQQIVRLLERGHDVRIFADSNPQQPQVQKEVLQHHLLQKTSYSVSQPASKWLLRLKAAAYLFRYFLCCPQTAARLVGTFRKEKYFSYAEVFFVSPFLREQFDIVHAHFGPNGLKSLILKKIKLPIKFVATFYGYDLGPYVLSGGHDVYRELFQQGDTFICISDAGKEKLLKLGAPEEKMIKIPMGIDLNSIPFKHRSYNPPEAIRLLSVGRLVEMKGREYALKAVAKLKDKYPLHYDIVGDGPLRPDLEKLAADLGLGSSVKFWGWTSSEALTDLYDQAHLFVHPSITSSDGNQEGQGMVLLEAQACGIPVVATKHGAFPDSLIDGRTGFLVPEKDADALAERLDFLISSPHLWPQMGRLGRRFVQDNFDSKILNNRLEDIYRRLVQAKQSQ